MASVATYLHHYHGNCIIDSNYDFYLPLSTGSRQISTKMAHFHSRANNFGIQRNLIGIMKKKSRKVMTFDSDYSRCESIGSVMRKFALNSIGSGEQQFEWLN